MMSLYNYYKIFIIFSITLFFIYGGFIFQDFGINDDYYIYFPSSDYFSHPLATGTLFYGRPLNALFKEFQYAVGSLEGQWVFRLISVLVLVLIATLICNILEIWGGLHRYTAVALTIIFITLPGFQVFAHWSTAYVCAPPFLAALICARFFDRLLNHVLDPPRINWWKLVHLWSFATIGILFLGMLLYPVTVMAYVFLPLAVLLFREERITSRVILRVVLHLTVLGIAAGLYFVYLKLFFGFAPFFTDRITQYPMSVSFDFLHKLHILWELEQTALTWQANGNLHTVYVMRLAFAVSLAMHMISRMRIMGFETRNFPIAVTEAVLIAVVVYITANIVNLVGDSYAPYTRHTLVFSVVYVLVLARGAQLAFSDLKAIIAPKDLAAIRHCTLALFMLLVVVGAYRSSTTAVELQVEDWNRTVQAVEKIAPKIIDNDVYVAGIMSNIPGGRNEMKAATSTWRTHAFLILMSALGDSGHLSPNYRNGELRVVTTNSPTSSLDLSYATKYGTKVHASFVHDPNMLSKEMVFDLKLDYRRLQ